MWNYRIIEQHGLLAIHEVHYTENGVPWTYTERPVSPEGDDLQDLKESFELYALALTKPVLRTSDFDSTAKQS
jgi:hypothetical protein